MIRFKPVPGSRIYSMDLHGNVVDTDGVKYIPDINNGMIEIKLYGKERIINFNSLRLLTHFEINNLHYENEDDIFTNIFFSKIKRDNKVLRSPSSYIAYFKEPIYYRDDFRIIPGYTRYAINRHGKLIDTYKNRVIKPFIKKLSNGNGYLLFNIYSPDKSSCSKVQLHRLLALAWVHNELPETRCIVNHIDANKLNNNLENLEWVTNKENIRKAIDMSLSSDEKPVKIRDIKTGIVKHFKSRNELRIYLNIPKSRVWNVMNMHKYALLQNRYEVKEEDDETPWITAQLENRFIDFGKINKIYTVKNLKTGEVLRFTKKSSLYKMLGIKKGFDSNVLGLDAKINKLNNRFPDYSFSYTSNLIEPPFYLYDLETKEMSIFMSMRKMCIFINYAQAPIRRALINKHNVIYSNRWIIKTYPTEIDKFNLNEYTHIDTPCVYRVSDINKKNIVFNTVKEVLDYTKISEQTFIEILDKGREIKGFRIWTQQPNK